MRSINDRDIFYGFWMVLCKLFSSSFNKDQWLSKGLEELHGPLLNQEFIAFLDKYGRDRDEG